MVARYLISFFCSMALASTFLVMPASADSKPNDAAALKGLKEVKVIFDITQGNPKKLLGRLNLIQKTAKMIAAEGVKPNFVLAFRGPSSFYVTKDHTKIPKGNEAIAEKIWAKVQEISTVSGIKLEQCAVATGFLKIDNKTVLPEIHVIGNSWISIIGYQNQGYAYLPVD